MSAITERSWVSRLVELTSIVFICFLWWTAPVRATLIVSDYGSTSVQLFTNSGQPITGSVTGSEGAACIAGGIPALFVADNSPTIRVYDPSTLVQLGSVVISGGSQVAALALSPDGSLLYAADYGAGEIFALKTTVILSTPSGGTVTPTYTAPTPAAHDVGVAPDGSVYTSQFNNQSDVAKFSPTLAPLGPFLTKTAATTIGLSNPGGILFAFGHVWISNFSIGDCGTTPQACSSIFELDLSGNVLHKIIAPSGSRPLGLALGPGDGDIYVALFAANKIGKIDVAGGVVSNSYPLSVFIANAGASPKYLQFTENCTALASAFLEICKSSSLTNPVTGTFTFTATNGTFTSAPIRVPVGFCSGPVPVPSGTVTVTEAATPGVGVSAIDAYGYNSSTSQEENRLVSSALTPRTVMVNVPAGSIATETVVEFTNFKVPTGVLEVCKDAAPGTTVTGNFVFTVAGAPNNPYVIPVGACSGPILVQAGSVTVTEAPRAGYSLVDVSTSPAGRVLSLNIPGGTAVVNAAAGDITAETVVRFVNDPASTATGQLKICKVAGVGVVEGQPFTFTVGGDTYTVPAGPATTGGDCVVAGTFSVGMVVTVAESLSAPYQLLNVTVNPPDRFIDSTNGQVHVSIGPGFTEVTFTNIGSTPTGELKVCKVAGPLVAIGTNFAFSVASPPNARRSGGSTQFKTLTVPAGPSATGGYCVVDGTFTVGSTVTVAEIPAAGYMTTGVTVNGTTQPGGTTSASVAIVNGITEVAFTNTISNGGNNPTSLNIIGYEVVSQSVAPGAQKSVTYHAALLNTGPPLDSLKATLTSLDPSHVQVAPGQDTLNFAPVPANSQVTSGDTFTILTDPAVPFDFSTLKWTLQAKPVLRRRHIAQNDGGEDASAVRTLVTRFDLNAERD